MTDLVTYPLEDWFETTLSQPWDWATWTVYVNNTPSFTFPSGVTTYIVVDPAKSNMQVAKINAYDWTAKTFTVSSISVNKGASLAYTQQAHKIGAVVRISTNYQFCKDIADAINSKVDGNSDNLIQGVYADATARDAALPSPATGMQAALIAEWYWTDYLGGAWIQRGTGATFNNASTTVAGKVELPTDAEVTSGTATGGTGATLTPTNAQFATSIVLKPNASDITADDAIAISQSGIDTVTGMTSIRLISNMSEYNMWEDAVSGNCLFVDTDGYARKSIVWAKTAAQLSTITWLDTWVTPLQCYYLSSDKALVAYQKSADNIVYARVITFAQRTPTVGTEQAISSAVSIDWYSIAVLSSTSFVCAYAKSDTGNKCYATACSISWTAISAGTEANMADGLVTATVPAACKVTSSKFAVVWKNNTGSNPRMNCGTVSGTTITPSAWSGAVEAVTMAWVPWLIYISDDKIWCWYDDWTNITFKQTNFTWTAMFFQTAIDTIAWSLTASRFSSLLFGESQLCLFLTVNTWIRVLTISLQAYWGTWAYDTTSNYLIPMEYNSASDYVRITWAGDGTGRFSIASTRESWSDVRITNCIMGISWITKINSTTVATTATYMSICKLRTSFDKFFVVWKNGTDLYYSVYQDTSDEHIGILYADTTTGNIGQVVRAGDAPASWLTIWTPYYVWDAWAVATTGTKRIGVATSTTNLFLN